MIVSRVICTAVRGASAVTRPLAVDDGRRKVNNYCYIIIIIMPTRDRKKIMFIIYAHVSGRSGRRVIAVLNGERNNNVDGFTVFRIGFRCVKQQRVIITNVYFLMFYHHK